MIKTDNFGKGKVYNFIFFVFFNILMIKIILYYEIVLGV